ncbi:MAG: DUF493 domain-containing protein [Burkholderiales bacterium]|nr:DUF493 domain-containing protein [Burkholderiales bacterium]
MTNQEMNIQEHPSSLLTFPCQYTIKIMGINTEEFVPQVTALIASLSDSFDPQANVAVKASANNKYLSISATITAKSQEQLNQIYEALNNHELVRITL